MGLRRFKLDGIDESRVFSARGLSVSCMVKRISQPHITLLYRRTSKMISSALLNIITPRHTCLPAEGRFFLDRKPTWFVG